MTNKQNKEYDIPGKVGLARQNSQGRPRRGDGARGTSRIYAYMCAYMYIYIYIYICICARI